MNFFPDITPFTNKLTDFTSNQKQSQQEIIALLKQNNFLLSQILTKLEKP
jgi:hypothetical protein